MELTPDEIVNYPLKRRTMGGYEIAQVDDLLDQLAATVDRLRRDLDDARARLAVAEERLEHATESEAEISRTLKTAQRAAEQTLADAEDEASELLEGARRDAETLREEGVREAEEAERAARTQLEAVQADLDALRVYEHEVRDHLRQELERHLRLLDDVAADEAPDRDPEGPVDGD